MVDGLTGTQPVQDIFGLGRLADAIRANRLEEQQRAMQQQAQITQGLQQEGLKLGLQQQRIRLADLALHHQQQQQLTSAIQAGVQAGQPHGVARFNALKQFSPDEALKYQSTILDQAVEIAKLNPAKAASFANENLGTQIEFVGAKDGRADFRFRDATDEAGNPVMIRVNQTTGDVEKVEGFRPETTSGKTIQPTTLERNLQAAGLVPGTPAYQQAVLSQLQKTGRTQRIEISPDGGINIIEEPGAADQKLAAKQKKDAEAKLEAARQRTESLDILLGTPDRPGKIDEALTQTGLFTAGIGSVLSFVPGTAARDLSGSISTIKSAIARDTLQQMREASPTGGALGSVSEKELALLQSAVASLDEGQSPESLRRNLEQVRTHYQNWKEAVEQGRALEAQGLDPNNATQDQVDLLGGGIPGTRVLNFDSQGNLIR